MDFSNFSSGQLLALSLLGFIIWLAIIYNIIKLAAYHGTNSAYKDQQLRKQTMLLIEMARKAGVKEEDIDSIINLNDE